MSLQDLQDSDRLGAGLATPDPYAGAVVPKFIPGAKLCKMFEHPSLGVFTDESLNESRTYPIQSRLFSANSS